jgi:predicted esterase
MLICLMFAYMQKHSLVTNKTARYFTAGCKINEAKLVVFALHGYAQLANDFLNVLLPAIPTQVCVIAPEGLNRFYAKGFGGKPAATWMTSEERECEIADYVNYLTQLYEHVLPQNFSGKTGILGFSQGVATASRWIANGQIKTDALIICSGDIALELRNPIHPAIKQIAQIHYISALQDPFLSESAKVDVQSVLKKLTCTSHYFEGGHEIHTPTLYDIFLKIVEPLV